VNATDGGPGGRPSPDRVGREGIAETRGRGAVQTGRPGVPAGGPAAAEPGAAVRGVSRRDQKAFARLIADHDERLRAIAYNVLRDRDVMDDVLQEVYIKAFVALPGFRGRSSLGTWLYRITYTTCIDALRRQRRLSAVPDELAHDALDPTPDPGDELAERERLSAALGALPPEQRVAVLLVDREGFDYRTVAEILDVPFGTAASRVSAARHALRRALGSSPEEGTP
jgi:RNA polymerase sigma-70 factor (ECF subfamily)